MADASPTFVFHLPGSWLGPRGTGLLPFYQKLTAGLAARDIAFTIRALNRETVMGQVAKDTSFHIINHGKFEHPRVLNAGVAYVYPFWNMDPKGIRAFSSIGGLDFRAQDIDETLARPFFRKLRQRLVVERRSRYPQPIAESQLPDGSVAVFLQSESHRGLGETCHVSQREMIDTVLNATDGPVVIKPHPLDESKETRKTLSNLSAQHPNLTITDCNLHDLLSSATRVVTINSAVGIEAYLHRKPVILCGQSDFHHIADTARDPQQLIKLLQSPSRKRAYDKYVYWYFGLQCLNTTDPALVDRFLSRFPNRKKSPPEA